MKGRILEITTMEDEFHNNTYQVTILFEKKPDFKLGDAEVQQ